MSKIEMINAGKPRIVFLVNYWKNGSGGGVITYLIGLTNELKKKGINLYVVFREGEDSKNYKIIGSRYIYPIKSLFILRKIRPDVIHVHGSWFCLLPGYLWKQFNSTRLICTMHTATVNPSFIEKNLMKFLLAKCDAVTFVSSHLEQNTKESYNVEIKATYITHAGVIAKSISEEEVRGFKEKFDIKRENPLLLGQALTSHRVKIEGAKRLIIATDILKESYPDILLVLTREGSNVQELKEFVKDRNMSSHVVFTGDLDDPFVAIKACDILTHITLDEGGVPIAILEAMSLGMPIVASAVGGIPEMINEQNGQLVSNDPNDIAKAIGFFLQNWDIAMMRGKKAEQDVRKYNWDETVNIFISLYMHE